MQPQLLSSGERARAPTKKPLALPACFLAETSGLWTPMGHSGAFSIYFLTHFTYVASPPPLLGVFTQALLHAGPAWLQFLGRQGAGTWGLSHHRQHHLISLPMRDQVRLLQTQGCLPALSVGSSVPGGRGS